MIKHFGYVIVIVMFTVSMVSMMSCGDNENKNNNTDGKNADLYIKDDTGERVKLVLKPTEGDTLRYKMVAKTTATETLPTPQGDQEVKSSEDITYFYTQVVDRVEESTVTYKVKFDSVQAVTSISSKDSSLSVTYNSNVQDSIHNMAQFVKYNSIIGEFFYVRVTAQDSVLELYGMEKIYDKISTNSGDTLREDGKMILKESLKSELQQQFQKFPVNNEIARDSSWGLSYETNLMVFPAKNILNYKVIDIKEDENGDIIVTIDASLTLELIKKEVSDQNQKLSVNSVNASGTGKVVINLTQGYTVSKQTQTNVDLDMKISAGGQSANPKQSLQTNLTIEKL